VHFLQEQDMTRFDAVNYISHGIAKAPGRPEARRLRRAAPVLGLRKKFRAEAGVIAAR